LTKNKKKALLEVLVRSKTIRSNLLLKINVELKFKTLEAKIESLSQKVIQFENQIPNSKDALSGL